MSMRASWLIVLTKSYIFLLIFCLLILVIIERGMLKYPTVITDLSIPPCSSTRFS